MSETFGIMNIMRYLIDQCPGLNLEWKIVHRKNRMVIMSKQFLGCKQVYVGYGVSTGQFSITSRIEENRLIVLYYHKGEPNIQLGKIRDLISGKPNYMKNSYQDLNFQFT